MKWVCVLVSGIFIVESGRTQVFHLPAKSVYLSGGAYSGQFTDGFSFTGNPAVLGSAKNLRVAMSTERRWMLKELDFSRIACSFSAGRGGIGLSFQRAGDADYQETAMALAYGKDLGRIALGIQFCYDQDKAPGYGYDGSGSAVLGMRVNPTEKIYAGLVFNTLVFGNRNKGAGEKGPEQYAMGIGYEVSSFVFLSMQLEKEAGIPMNVEGSVDYRWSDQFYASIGIGSNAASPFARAGWKKNRLLVEIFAAYHVVLGFTPGVALFWEGKNKAG
jgi:hypothetical protein